MVLNKGDVFVFPIGLIHFQFNTRHSPAIAFASLSSQNIGVITIASAVFGSMPPINADVLTKAFQVDKNLINYIQKHDDTYVVAISVPYCDDKTCRRYKCHQ
ncbi:hypothetical protein UlMin_002570 [Ulmus minor]